MIVLATPPNYGAKLFLEVFARLLGLQYGMEVESCSFPSALVPQSNPPGALRFLSPDIVIDGEWPRLRELNLPLPTEFFSRRIPAKLTLAGEFRQWQFYQSHRQQIRQEFFGLNKTETVPGKLVVLARLFKQSGRGDASAHEVVLRPTMTELQQLVPNHSPSNSLVLSPMPVPRQDFAWMTAGYSIRHGHDRSVINAAQTAETVVGSEDSIHWWAAFLSNARNVLLLSYGEKCRSCHNNLEERVGRSNLLFKDGRTDWKALSRSVNLNEAYGPS
jgi:hypothetical protein